MKQVWGEREREREREHLLSWSYMPHPPTHTSIHVGKILKDFKLQAGDDAGAVTWMAATSKLNLYASHLDFIHKVVELRQAAW